MTENDENRDIIKLLKKELKTRENEIQLAAKYGKQLLEERDDALRQIDVLKQEKHSLLLNVEAQTQSIRSQASELESYVKQVDSLKIDVPALENKLSVLKQRNANWLKEKQDLEKTVEDLQLENSSLKNKILLLQHEIETCKNLTILDDTRCEEDRPDIDGYISKIKSLEDTICELQHELGSSQLNEKRLLQAVKELEEKISDLDQELSSEVQRKADLQETLVELQCEVESLKHGQLDVNRRGNSMFAELDDRRKDVEKQFKELSKKYSNMLQNYEENKKELINCKGQMTILASMASKKHQEDQIQKLRQRLSDALRDKEELTFKLSHAEKLLEYTVPATVEGDQYNYLRIMLKQAQEKCKKVENELMLQRVKSLEAEKSLFGSMQQLYDCQEALQEQKCENLKLKQKLKEINSGPEICVSSKPKVNIEILPGYESNPECKKENADPAINSHIISGKLLKDKNSELKEPKISNELSLPTSSHLEVAESALKEINKDQTAQPVAGKRSATLNTPERRVNCPQQ